VRAANEFQMCVLVLYKRRIKREASWGVKWADALPTTSPTPVT